MHTYTLNICPQGSFRKVNPSRLHQLRPTHTLFRAALKNPCSRTCQSEAKVVKATQIYDKNRMLSSWYVPWDNQQDARITSAEAKTALSLLQVFSSSKRCRITKKKFTKPILTDYSEPVSFLKILQQSMRITFQVFFFLARKQFTSAFCLTSLLLDTAANPPSLSFYSLLYCLPGSITQRRFRETVLLLDVAIEKMQSNTI